MTRPRLREKPLDLAGKPRVVQAFVGGNYWAERMTPHGPYVVSKPTFDEAISVALAWAGPKKEATK